jgi:hypothetical protein
MRLATLRMFTFSIMLCAGLPASPGEIRSQDWAWNAVEQESVYAATFNSAKHMLAQFCYTESGNCVYAVAFGISCEEDSEYPALVNTDEGAQSIKLVCGGETDGQHLMLITEFDVIDRMIRKGARIGFVMPMQGDEFKAVRFSLRGATRALDSMRLAAEKIRAMQEDRPRVSPAVERL